MEIVYQCLLAVAIILLGTLLLYSRRWCQRFQTQLATEKQYETNLRRELHDTTEHLQHARQDVQFYQALLSMQQDAVLVFPLDNRDQPAPCSYANPAACKLLEHDSNETHQLLCSDIECIPTDEIAPPPSDMRLTGLGATSSKESMQQLAQNRIRQQIKSLLEGRDVSRSTRIVTHQQHVIHVELHAALIARGNNRYMMYTLRNEEPIRKIMQERDAIRKRQRDVFQSAQIGLAVYNAKHKLKSANTAWLRIFGCPSHEEMQQLQLFSVPIIPEAACEQLHRGENLQLELTVDFDNWINQHGFITNRRRKAFLSLFFQNLGRDAQQKPLGHIVQVLDITELRENEAALALCNAQLQQARKMEAIGKMTGGIAHDFNNILTPILGYSEIGLDFCEENTSLREFISEIHTATLRAKDLVSQILIYSRQSDEGPSKIHLIPIVKEVSKQQSAILEPHIEVRTHIRTKEDLVLANPTQMHQVMTNLATNAAYAMRDTGGTLDIQLTTFNMGWRHRQEFPQLRRGSYVRLTIKDTGPGIPEDIHDRIFAPFFSTKPHGEGTGMGLAVVQSIIDAVGGGIALESTLGEGATFHIALPLIQVEPHPPSTSWTAPPVSGKTILFVDDEPPIVRMAEPLLESIGYVPMTCTSAAEAMRVLEDPAASETALLVTDHVMPTTSGLELAMAVKTIKPQLPIVICTGYPAKLNPAEALAAGVQAILVKPVTRQDLSDTLAKVLQGQNLLAHALKEKPAEEPPQDREDPQQQE